MTERESSPDLAQLVYYMLRFKEKKSRNKIFHAINRLTVITLGASIPVLTTIEAAGWITALVGAAIVVVTGVGQVFTPHERYITFRNGYKDLDRERMLFLAKVDIYEGDDDIAEAALAKRTADIISSTEASVVSVATTEDPSRRATNANSP